MLIDPVLSVRHPVNSRLVVVKLLGSQKFYVDYLLCGGLAPPTPHCSRVICVYNGISLSHKNE